MDRSRKDLVDKGEQERMKECNFQPNVGRVVTKNVKKPQKDGKEEEEPDRKKTGKEIATRLFSAHLAAKKYTGKTKE